MTQGYYFIDRYGGNYPDTSSMCKGDCEGMGVVPVKLDDENEIYNQGWRDAEKEKPSDDGWHFVKCKDCGGTGKSQNQQS